MNALIAFQNVTLIDGTGREPLANATVGVRGGRIVYAGQAMKWQPSLEEDIINLDFAGKYLLPGLIDCHVHLSASAETDSQSGMDDGAMTLRVLHNARKNLAAGITTVRDMGGERGLEFVARSAIRSGEFNGPRLMLTAKAISRGEWSVESDGSACQVNGTQEVRQAVCHLIEMEVDFVRLDLAGRASVEDVDSKALSFTVDEIRAAVEEADRFGKKVAVLAHDIEALFAAVQAGVYSIEHGTYLHQSPGIAEEMAQRGIFLVPTLKTNWEIIHSHKSGVPRSQINKSKVLQEDKLRSFQLAYQAGVPIAMGSGAASPFNFHGENALEIYYMQQAGMKPMDALVSSTCLAAKALGRDTLLGSVEDGKIADLLVMDENPLEDLKKLADKKLIRAVFLDGKLAARQAADSYPKAILARDCLTVGE